MSRIFLRVSFQTSVAPFHPNPLEKNSRTWARCTDAVKRSGSLTSSPKLAKDPSIHHVSASNYHASTPLV